MLLAQRKILTRDAEFPLSNKPGFSYLSSVEKLPISVCIISGAEAHRIGKALDSVSDWTSEIILVLNEDVQDGTAELAAQFGAKVTREKWKGHIAQKNSAADKASQPWILAIDSDEVVPPTLRDEIARLFTDGYAAQYAAYSFPRCTIYCNRWIRHGDWYPDRQTRLWQRGKARWGGLDPHDKLLVQGAVGKLNGDLLHHSMESMEQQFRKTVAYASDFARHCAETKKRIYFPELILRPGWRFFRAYVLRAGFLDGWQGFAIARVIGIYTFLRYLRAYQAQKEVE